MLLLPIKIQVACHLLIQKQNYSKYIENIFKSLIWGQNIKFPIVKKTKKITFVGSEHQNVS